MELRRRRKEDSRYPRDRERVCKQTTAWPSLHSTMSARGLSQEAVNLLGHLPHSSGGAVLMEGHGTPHLRSGVLNDRREAPLWHPKPRPLGALGDVGTSQGAWGSGSGEGSSPNSGGSACHQVEVTGEERDGRCSMRNSQ